MVAVIDYDAGNIRSVEKAIVSLGGCAEVTRQRQEILSADHIILPGVGSFGDAMGKLHTSENFAVYFVVSPEFEADLEFVR